MSSFSLFFTKLVPNSVDQTPKSGRPSFFFWEPVWCDVWSSWTQAPGPRDIWSQRHLVPETHDNRIVRGSRLAPWDGLEGPLLHGGLFWVSLTSPTDLSSSRVSCGRHLLVRRSPPWSRTSPLHVAPVGDGSSSRPPVVSVGTGVGGGVVGLRFHRDVRLPVTPVPTGLRTTLCARDDQVPTLTPRGTPEGSRQGSVGQGTLVTLTWS